VHRVEAGPDAQVGFQKFLGPEGNRSDIESLRQSADREAIVAFGEIGLKGSRLGKQAVDMPRMPPPMTIKS
jgi:hypothetical protein